MKKFLAIGLFSVYLFSATELHQLLKLPMLVQHFVEHSENNPGLSILEFLAMHYAAADMHDADYEKDMKLPFKTTCNVFNSLSPVAIFQLQQDLPRAENFGTRSLSHFYKFPISTSPISLIWQPPKAC